MQTLTIQTHLKIEYPLTSTPTRLFFFEMVKLQKVEDSWPASQVIKLTDPAWYSLWQATLYVAIYIVGLGIRLSTKKLLAAGPRQSSPSFRHTTMNCTTLEWTDRCVYQTSVSQRLRAINWGTFSYSRLTWLVCKMPPGVSWCWSSSLIIGCVSFVVPRSNWPGDRPIDKSFNVAAVCRKLPACLRSADDSLKQYWTRTCSV